MRSCSYSRVATALSVLLPRRLCSAFRASCINRSRRSVPLTVLECVVHLAFARRVLVSYSLAGLGVVCWFQGGLWSLSGSVFVGLGLRRWCSLAAFSPLRVLCPRHAYFISRIAARSCSYERSPTARASLCGYVGAARKENKRLFPGIAAPFLFTPTARQSHDTQTLTWLSFFTSKEKSCAWRVSMREELGRRRRSRI